MNNRKALAVFIIITAVVVITVVLPPLFDKQLEANQRRSDALIERIDNYTQLREDVQLLRRSREMSHDTERKR